MKPKLIKTLEEVQQHVPVAMTANFDVVAPFFASAEAQYLVKTIGKAEFTALQEAYNYTAPEEPADGDLPAPSAEQLEAVAFCQKIVANLGYYLAIPVLSVTVTGSGIQTFSSGDTKTAFQWQTEELKDALQELGFGGIEELLELLESDAEIFAGYHDSDQYKDQQTLLIRSAADFTRYYDIEGSRYVYQNILSLLRRVESQTMSRVLGADFYASLKESELTDHEQKLVNGYLKPGLALLTAAKAMTERVITLDGGKAVFNFRGSYNNMKESMAATRDQIKDTCEQLEADGNDFISSGLQFIMDNPAEFEAFEPPVVKRRFKFNNDPAKGIFGV